MDNTILMLKVFSDQTPDSFKDSINDCIQEALVNGQAVYSDEGEQLYFASVDGNVIVEDKKNGNEVTVATPESDGSTTLTPAVPTKSATQPNAVVPRVTGKDGEKLAGTAPDVSISIKPAITDKDKAGVEKNFSVSFDGFQSEEEAREFSESLEDMAMENEMYSELEESSLTFSDEEVENAAYSANELQMNVERLAGTDNLELAYDIMDQANQLRSYSTLAGSVGHDMDDVIEMCNTYSEFADERASEIIANMSVNEYFSNFDEDDLNAYFSGLDEVEAEVLYSALEEGDDTITFSDVQDAIDATYEEAQLNTPMQAVFSEMEEDEVNEIFSDLTEVEYDVLSGALDENPNLTFSEANEILSEVNMPLNEMFSDYSEEDFNEMFSEMSDDEVEVFCDMLDDENATYSDYIETVDEMMSFSDDDCEILANNANQIYSAYEDLVNSPDYELAEQVEYYSEKTLEDCAKAEANGHDVTDVTKLCMESSSAAKEIKDKMAKVDPKEFCGTEGEPVDTKSYSDFSSEEDDSVMRTFSDGFEQKALPCNPCLTSPIN